MDLHKIASSKAILLDHSDYGKWWFNCTCCIRPKNQLETDDSNWVQCRDCRCYHDQECVPDDDKPSIGDSDGWGSFVFVCTKCKLRRPPNNRFGILLPSIYGSDPLDTYQVKVDLKARDYAEVYAIDVKQSFGNLSNIGRDTQRIKNGANKSNVNTINNNNSINNSNISYEENQNNININNTSNNNNKPINNNSNMNSNNNITINTTINNNNNSSNNNNNSKFLYNNNKKPKKRSFNESRSSDVNSNSTHIIVDHITDIKSKRLKPNEENDSNTNLLNNNGLSDDDIHKEDIHKDDIYIRSSDDLNTVDSSQSFGILSNARSQNNQLSNNIF